MSISTQLETERLILRGLQRRDAGRIAELAGQREIAETTLTIPHPYTLDDAISFIQSAQEWAGRGESYTFGITLKPNGLLIGCIGIGNDVWHHRGELGYWMGVPYWGNGYTTEAARRMLQFAFDELQLNRVYAAYFTHNLASARVLQKIGMTYEGTLRQHYFRWDQFRDAGYYGILRDEYTGAGGS